MNSKRADRASLSYDRPWTAKRCLRMLRPISNEIMFLKMMKYGSTGIPVARSKPARKRSADESDEDTAKPIRRKHADPDWVPEHDDKRPVKRQYTGRPLRLVDQDRSLRPGELTATPLIARHSGSGGAPYASPDTHQENPLSRGTSLAPPLRYLRHLDAKAASDTPTDVLTHINRLFSGYKQLLLDSSFEPKDVSNPNGMRCAWDEEDDDHPKGPRSLMATCLRQVPIYMDGRQAWEDANDNKVDANQSVYEELEEVGTNGGWKKLRQVVRAHATNMMVQAIEVELLDESQFHCLIRLCDGNDADDSCREFLSAFAFTCGRLPPPPGSQAQLFDYGSATYPGVTALYSWAERKHDWSFFYRQIGSMITEGLLPFEWLATKPCKPVWTRILLAILCSSNAAHYEAMNLLRTVLLVSCGVDPAKGKGPSSFLAKNSYSVVHFMKKAFNTTISSLCTILSSIVLVSNQEYGSQPEDAHAIHSAFEEIAAELVSKVFADGFLKAFSKGSAAPERIATILTTVLVIRVCGKQLESPVMTLDHSTITKALHTINRSAPKALENLPELICSTVKSCGKVNREDGFTQLQAIVVFLLGTGGHKTSWFMERLALDSVDEFAHTYQSGKQDRRYSRDGETYFAFLREVEAVVDSRQPGMSAAPTPFRRSLRDANSSTNMSLQSSDRSGYRWEAGLQEWVTITPRVRRPQAGQAACIKPSQLAATRLAWDEIKSNPSLGSPLLHHTTAPADSRDELAVDLSSPLNPRRESLESQDESSTPSSPGSMPTLAGPSTGSGRNYSSPIVLIPAWKPPRAIQHQSPPKFKTTLSGMQLRRRQQREEPKVAHNQGLRRSARTSKRINMNMDTMSSSFDSIDSGFATEFWSDDDSNAGVGGNGFSFSSASTSPSLQSSENRHADEDGDSPMMEEEDTPGNTMVDDTDELSLRHAARARHPSPSVVVPAPRSRKSTRPQLRSSSFRQEDKTSTRLDSVEPHMRSTRSKLRTKSKAQDTQKDDLGSEDELSLL
ncbi:hypothetical protein IWX90DRAFT_431720 [Phyllosticta citrichinensis]|uniref:Uncharacterized protein n=1 Tax=Phyllosticta citrichinensis TaxID=1130410 RepID=A0ABR1XXI5_9PEZI